LGFDVLPLVWNTSENRRFRIAPSIRNVSATVAPDITEAATKPVPPKRAVISSDRNEQAKRMKNHTHVRRLQYATAPSGNMPSDMRCAKQRHKGFRPGRSESPNSKATIAQNILPATLPLYLPWLSM
jgi:hypothetical protein